MEYKIIDIIPPLRSEDEILVGEENERQKIAEAFYEGAENVLNDNGFFDEDFTGNSDYMRGYYQALVDVGVVLETYQIGKSLKERKETLNKQNKNG